jgi:hypothetical protein
MCSQFVSARQAATWLVLGVFAIILLVQRPAGADPPEALGPVTCHWEDSDQQQVFVVQGQRYALRVGTQPARIIDLRIDGKSVNTPKGLTVALIDNAGLRFVPASVKAKPQWQVHTGQKPAPAKSSRARMNVWRASPVYWEVHLRDIPFVPEADPDLTQPTLPIRGELVMHAYTDRVHIELRVTPVAGQTPVRAAIEGSIPSARVSSLAGRAILVADNVSVLAGVGGAFENQTQQWNVPIDRNKSAWWVIRPTVAGANSEAVFAPEVRPLPDRNIVMERGVLHGYDARSGLYRLSTDALRGAFAFDPAHKIPNRRISAPMRVTGDDQDRNVVVICSTGMGNLEAGVIADRHGFPLPITAFVAKNFQGENEEPEDVAFGDILFPLRIEPDQDRSLQVLALFQNWGDHALKQVSSIRFFNIYWHLSTGLSETTCFTHAYMKMRGTYVAIPDFRPYSGPFMMGQPQHECYAWPGLLQYASEDGEVKLLYDRTVFRSVAPNLAQFTMFFRTSDSAATARVEVIEIPQKDEARTFLRVRYEWSKPLTIQGDARLAFRWLNIFEKNLPKRLVWLDAQDGEKVMDVAASDQPAMLARPLSGEGAFAGVHEQRDAYSSLVLVQRLVGKLGGKPITQPHLSAMFDATGGSYWFASPDETLKIQPGDFIEADLMLMPHAQVTTPLYKARRERLFWYERPPAIASVSRGEKLHDFPAAVRAEGDVAQFVVQGGLDTVPVVVEGFSRASVPMLWRSGVWQDQQVHGGDGYQVDSDGDGKFRFTFVYPIRGKEKHDLVVSLMKCSMPIRALTDDNGFAAIEAEGAGDFTTQSPGVWSPGTNTVVAGSRLVKFFGHGQRVQQVPVEIKIAKGTTDVKILSSTTDKTELTVSGDACEVRFPHRPEGTPYTLSVDGNLLEIKDLSAPSAVLSGGDHRVVLERVNPSK